MSAPKSHTGPGPVRRRRLGMVAVAALLVWAALGWRYVAPGPVTVRDSHWLRVEGRLLQPGWQWIPRGIMSLRSYPRAPQEHAFHLGGSGQRRLLTAEGAGLELSGILTWKIEESGEVRLAQQGGSQVEKRLLEPAADAAARVVMASGMPLAPGAAAEAVMARELGARLTASGITLVGLRLLAVARPGKVAAEAGPLPGARVLIIGWDGADWNVIDPLLQRGEMPNLSRLIEGGSRARLKTVAPVLSPVIWTSVATGVRPEKHGIVDFLAVDPVTGTRVPVTSNLRRSPALWTLLARHQAPVGIVAWWATWPAEPVSGYLITDRIAYQLFGMAEKLQQTSEGKTWPPDLWNEIEPLMVAPDQITDAQLGEFAPLAVAGTLEREDEDLLREFRTVLAATETYAAIDLYLARPGTVLRCVYFEASDTAAHLFMPFAAPQRTAVPETRFKLWGGVVDGIYRDLDRRLGLILESVEEGTTVMLVSDHGFRSGENRPVGDARIGAGRAADWHRKYGILVVSGARARAGGQVDEASVLDVAPTALALLGLPVPEEMDGVVLEQALDTSFLRRHPPRRLASDNRAPVAPVPVASPVDAAIIKRLQSLGYVGTDDVHRLEQDEVTAYNNRATILLGEGKAEDAIAELETGLARSPGSIPLLANLGRALRQTGDDDRALTVLQPLLERDRASPGLHNLVGNIFMDRRDYRRAETHFRQAKEIDPSYIDADVSLGILAERQGRLEDALEHYRRAGRIDPDAPEGFNNIGNVHRQMALEARARGDEAAAGSQYALAEEAYLQGLAADADFIGTYNNLALIYQENGRAEEAMAQYRRALERAPDHAVVHNNLGSLYFAAGRLEDARQAFEHAIESDPEYESAHNNLGAVLGQLGQREEELEAYRKAVELDPDYADGHHNLGLAYLRRQDLDAAEAELMRTLELRPDYISAHATLAQVAMLRGQPRQAMEHLDEALRLNPSIAALHNQMAEACLAAGETGRGAASLRRSLKLNPDQPAVRQRLGSLAP